VFGVQWTLGIDAVSFAVSLAAIWAVRIAAEHRAARAPRVGFGRELAAGLRFFRGSPVLVAVAVGVVVATLGTGAINVLMVYFLKANLHAAPKWLGTLDAGEGAGAVIGALATGWLAAKVGSGRVFWAGLAGAGIALVVLSRATSLAAAIAVLACTGVIVGAVNVSISALMIGVTPQEMLGRVSAVIGPLANLASVISMGAFGFIASYLLAGFHARIAGVAFGPYDTIFAACGLLFVVAGLAAIRPLRAAGDAAPGEPEYVAAEPAPS
jgi:MFS family permease